MRSLRFQLLAGISLGMAVVLLASGAVLYTLISRTLWTEFDESLAGKARSLTALAEQERGELDFELTEVSLHEFEPSEHAEYYQIWLPNGTVFDRSPSLRAENLDRISGPADAPAFRTVTLPDGRPGRLVGMEFVPRQENSADYPNPPETVTLVLARELTGLQATLARVRGMMVGVGLGAVVLAAGVLSWVVRRGLHSIRRLSRQISAVGEDDLSRRIDADGIPKELSPVVDRLNELLTRLDAAFCRERRFTGDVAHELRTPLAGVRSKLELALSRARAPSDYQRTLSDCLEISLQMQRIVENLLHLARADAGQLEIRRELVDLTEVLRECWKPLRDKAEARGLRVEWRLSARGTVQSDRDNLRLAVQNILDNAVAYADDGGQVTVATSTENGAIVLAVGNTGAQLSGADLQRVFDRFWRADSSCRDARETHGGLGLPLCKAVIERLGGTIEAGTTPDGRFTLTIRLPRTG